MTTSTTETRIEASPDVPVITITREFAAPATAVFDAHVDPALFAQWVGPRGLETVIETWEARTGGEWRYRARREGLDVGFWGSFHEVRPGERIVQTFSFDGAPDGVSLETITFEDLPDGRSRIVATSVVESMAVRDQILASGMEVGVVEGYEKLDGLLG